MSTPQLCFDLVRLVVDLVHREYDVATLQACTLVCQAWRCASRPYVFRRITIINRSSLVEFERILDNNNSVGAMVEILVMRSVKEPFSYPYWIMKVVRRLPVRLPMLQTIEITNLLEDGTICAHKFFHALSKFTTVTTLKLHECTMELRMLYSFVCALPGLRRLHVGPIITSHDWRVNIPPQLPLPSLTTLSLGVQDCDPEDMLNILEWAVGHSAPTLHTFHLDIEYLHSECVAKFFEDHGPLLEHLSLRLVRSVNHIWEYDLIKGDISLTHCTHLKSLVIHDFNHESPTFVDFVKQITSPIQRLTIDFVSSDFEGGMPDFKSLGEVLARPNVAGLQIISVVCRGMVNTEDLMARLRLDMPQVCHRGIVRAFRTRDRRRSDSLPLLLQNELAS